MPECQKIFCANISLIAECHPGGTHVQGGIGEPVSAISIHPRHHGYPTACAQDQQERAKQAGVEIQNPSIIVLGAIRMRLENGHRSGGGAPIWRVVGGLELLHRPLEPAHQEQAQC